MQFTARLSSIDSLLYLFSYLIGHSGRRYCYPSQEKICELLERFYGIRRSRRTLNRWLSHLEKLGYIRRIRRVRRNKKGGIEFTTTAYYLCKKSLKILKALKKNLAKFSQKFAGFFRYSKKCRIPIESESKIYRSREGSKAYLNKLLEVIEK